MWKLQNFNLMDSIYLKPLKVASSNIEFKQQFLLLVPSGETKNIVY